MTDLDWNERDTLELETALVDDGHVQLAGGYLSGEHPIPEVGTELWIVLCLHQFGSSCRRCTVTPGNLCSNGIAPNQWSP